MDIKRFYAVKIISALVQMDERTCSRVYYFIAGLMGKDCNVEEPGYICKINDMLNKASAEQVKELCTFAEGYLDYETQAAQA